VRQSPGQFRDRATGPGHRSLGWTQDVTGPAPNRPTGIPSRNPTAPQPARPVAGRQCRQRGA
jgi:hypothetical protein